MLPKLELTSLVFWYGEATWTNFYIYIYILFLYLCLLLGIYICDLFDVILRLNRGGQTICVFCCFFGRGLSIALQIMHWFAVWFVPSGFILLSYQLWVNNWLTTLFIFSYILVNDGFGQINVYYSGKSHLCLLDTFFLVYCVYLNLNHSVIQCEDI